MARAQERLFPSPFLRAGGCAWAARGVREDPHGGNNARSLAVRATAAPQAQEEHAPLELHSLLFGQWHCAQGSLNPSTANTVLVPLPNCGFH